MLNMLNVTVDIAGRSGNISPIVNLGVFVSRIVSLFLIIAAIVTFLYLVMGGIKWIMASNDSGKLEEARGTITNALIGLAITASAWALFLIVNYFLGLNIVVGSGTGSGGIPGGSGGGSGAVGNAACVCGGGRGCATTGDIGALSLGGDCYRCDASGWRATGTSGNCGAITCAQCP